MLMGRLDGEMDGDSLLRAFSMLLIIYFQFFYIIANIFVGRLFRAVKHDNELSKKRGMITLLLLLLLLLYDYYLVNTKKKTKQKIGNFFITKATDFYPHSSSVIFAFEPFLFLSLTLPLLPSHGDDDDDDDVMKMKMMR